MTSLISIGLGYSAQQVSAELSREGWRILGTARSPAGVQHIASMGWEGLLFDGMSASEEVYAALGKADHILVSAAPDSHGDPVLRHLSDEIAAARPKWIGYLSTIGVYGDCGGAWVDETRAPQPGSLRSKRRWQAEQQWLAFASRHDLRVEIFRLAGIYGPGRSAIDNLREGTARRIVKPGQVFNRIHVADIAATVRAAIAAPPRFDVYNVTDDEPAPPQDVVAFGARLLNIPVPPEIPLEQAGLSEMGLSFYGENKRVSNQRIKEALGVKLAYPTYREGIAALAAGKP